jgi:hypothetical protein
MNKKLKIFIIVVVVIIVAIFGMSYLGSKKIPEGSQSTSPLSSTTGVIPLPNANKTQSTQASDEFSNLLSSIKRITIDTSLFDNPAYKMLRDFPVALGSDIVGRTNPFAPIGSDIGGVPVQDVFVDTLQSGKVTSTTAEFGAQITIADTVPTSVVFEYGTNDTFGNATSPVVVTKNGTTLVTVTKLIPQTTYYVRAIAVRGSLTTTGNTTSFTTTKK